MRVERLALKDFRGITDLSLEFEGSVTVLAGINGAGKSSILHALATMLWRVGGSIHEGPRERQPLQASDVRNGAKAAELMIETNGPLGKVDWGLRVERTLSSVTRRPQAERLRSVAEHLREQLEEEPTTPVPFAVFYRTNRAVLDIPLRIRKKHKFDQFTAFDEALDGGWSSFRLFFEWFREREDVENQERARSRKFVDHQLQAVREAVAALMPGFSDLRVQRVPLRMTIAKDGTELDLGQLSDGEKCLLAMVADIARRLALANPVNKEPRKAAAIVLIDEIELHMHPQWQRQVIPGLQATFPNCQFIVSTHSPQVLSSVRPEGVYLLERKDGVLVAVRPSSSFGRHSNQILLELMRTPDRPEEIRARLNEMFSLIDKGDVEGARKIRSELEQDIGVDEPEFVRADILLRLRKAK